MVAGSNKSRRKLRKSMSPEERAQAERDVRGAVYDFQDTAYANLRTAIANVAIFFGFVGVFATVVGAAAGLRLIPMAVLVLAGLAGIAYYPVRHQRKLAVRLLVVSSALVVVGLAGLVLVATVLER
ncbi:hypothetical protein NCC78_07100 [Micromonospora phytophila]|uniref:hypothetical protein n=1 Tax=Micromonospora phytophila TaxID=709888 RepID=UPI00202ED6CD|nr:hypothetical protein [Micromonospora phytophila]MCM0674454.1 hypothetical protein [Micromonospora phytophila]